MPERSARIFKDKVIWWPGLIIILIVTVLFAVANGFILAVILMHAFGIPASAGLSMWLWSSVAVLPLILWLRWRHEVKRLSSSS